MFLRQRNRKKDGKAHRYFSVVENRRLNSGKTVQRTVLYLGEINDKQEAAWRKTLLVFDEDGQAPRNLSFFPEDREIPAGDLDSIQVKLGQRELHRPRLFGSCWLGCELWHQLELDTFWQRKLPDGREMVSWEKVLQLLVVNRLVAPSSEFHVHRQWFLSTAMDELLQVDLAVAEKDRLYRCLDRLLEHKRGYSRDGRPDYVQVVIALVVTTDGFPLAYEVMNGKTIDSTTLSGFLDKIKNTYFPPKRC